VLKVGLTGNIAAGKSAVASAWAAEGAFIVDADRLAREAVLPGTPALAAIRAEWGEGVIAPDGALDRAALRDVVFRDPAARARLEAIVHPAIAALRAEAYRRAEAAGELLVVADVPLLFEVGMDREMDLVVLVDAPEALREERLVRDRGLSVEEARRMIAAQMPSAEKRARADYLIENTGTLYDLTARASTVWAELRARAAAEGS
jgi:dephospho-CoA kinase